MIIYFISLLVVCQTPPAPKKGVGAGVLSVPNIKSQTTGVLSAPTASVKAAGVLAVKKSKISKVVAGRKRLNPWVTTSQMDFDKRNPPKIDALKGDFTDSFESEFVYEVAKFDRWEKFVDKEFVRIIQRLPDIERDKFMRRFKGMPPLDEDERNF